MVDYASVPPAMPPAKKSGCGCFLIGCLVLFLLVATPFIGGTIYLYSLSDEEWGDKVVWILRNDSFATGFKDGIRKSKDMTDEDKEAVIQLYDSLLKNYDSLTPEEQAKVKRNIVVVFRKLADNPKGGEAPPEFLELMELLQPGSTNGMTPPAADPSLNVPAPEPVQPAESDKYNF